MLDLFNIIFLAATLVSNITLYSDSEYLYPKERESVVAVSSYREWWRADGKGKCKYTGLMVPYVRDWEEVVNHGDSMETTLPPEPDKTAGHAIIINRKVCGESVEPMFRVASLVGVVDGYRTQFPVAVFDVTEMRPDQRPKWLGQVLSRIERASANDATAREFIEFNKKSSLKLPADLDATVKHLGDTQAKVEGGAQSPTPVLTQ